MKFASFVATVSFASLLCACTVGPDYAGPPVGVASPDWIEQGSKGAVDATWWARFNDPLLTELIARAIVESPDVRAAQARLREARADRDVAAGRHLPQVSANGAATANRLSENGQIPVGEIPGFTREFDLFDAGFDASWEIDLWGRGHRQDEAATARVDAAEAEQRGAMISLAAEIARTYIDLRNAQARLASAQIDADARTGIAVLVRQRFDAGEASRLEWNRAESEARGSTARLPRLEADIRAAAYAIALLAGKPPETLVSELLEPRPIPQAPDGIAMGLRSELLRRRPDIISAERLLAAATADVGVATADLFPRFSLLGSVGTQAREPGDLLSVASTRFQIGPSLHWPIFSAGIIRAQIRAADARLDVAAARYEKTVLTALSESETAANRFTRAALTLGDSRMAKDAEARALGLAQQRFSNGEDDRLALLEAQAAAERANGRLSEAMAARALQAVALYKALGGEWEQAPEG